MRNPLSILFLLLWLLLGYFYWTSSQECCQEAPQETSAISTVDESSNDVDSELAETANAGGLEAPLLFKADNANPTVGETWESKKSEILTNLGEEKILEIIGKYKADEKNDTEFENLGLARANEIRKLFSDLPDERVRTLSKLMEDNQNLSSDCYEFDFKVNNEDIKEVANTTRIYFPFRSTKKLNNERIETYLNDVAERVIKTGEKVSLVGHTDNVSSNASNMRLGLKRANVVADYLKNKGVPDNQIMVSSKGETEPVADNSTAQGRAENRRTELQIIK